MTKEVESTIGDMIQDKLRKSIKQKVNQGIDSNINSPAGSVGTSSCNSNDIIETPKADDELKIILNSGQNIVKVNEILKKHYDLRDLV